MSYKITLLQFRRSILVLAYFMKKLSAAFMVYLIYCSVIAFVDFDWDAESEHSVKASMAKQVLYMNRAQLEVYFDDLSTIDAAGSMGGMNGKRLDGKEVDDIHDLANEIRQQRGKALIEFPSKSFTNAVRDFFVIPFLILMNRN